MGKQISVNVEDSVFQALKTEADNQDRTLGKQVARVLRDWAVKTDANAQAVNAPREEPEF